MKHWKALKNLTSNLKVTQYFILLYKSVPRMLHAQYEAYFVACVDTRQSKYGTLFYYGN